MQPTPSAACGRAFGASKSQDFGFRRQVVLAGFIADFACFDARQVVEVDSATHSTDQEIARDAARSAGFAVQEFDILRFTNDDV